MWEVEVEEKVEVIGTAATLHPLKLWELHTAAALA